MSFNDNDKNPWDVESEDNTQKKSNRREPLKKNINQSNKNGYNPTILDFIETFKKTINQKKFNSSGGPTPPNVKPPKSLIVVGLLSATVLYLSSGLFLIQEGEVAAILRFGKVIRITSNAGLHFRLPAPFEQEVIRNVVEVHQIDSTASHGLGNDQNLILTGDENMVMTDYTVQWNIKDLNQFLFILRNPESTIKAAAESAIREIIGQTTARLALTEGREEIGVKTQALLQKILDFYNAGVSIISFKLQKVEPPLQVVDAFNDMQASRVDADRLSNEAQAYSNDILPKARGQAESNLRAAEAYAAEIVAKAEGEAARFSKIYGSYKKDPNVTRIRMHREFMEKLLKSGNISIVDKDIGNSIHNYRQITPPKILDKKE